MVLLLSSSNRRPLYRVFLRYVSYNSCRGKIYVGGHTASNKIILYGPLLSTNLSSAQLFLFLNLAIVYHSPKQELASPSWNTLLLG